MSFLAGGIISGLGSLFGGLLGKSAAEKAADVQANAAKYASDQQATEYNKALDFSKGVYNNSVDNLNPYVSAGQQGLTTLTGMLPGLTTPYQNFTAPTGVDETNDPGYQFRLSQGQQALENSAAAKGGLLSGGTAKALDQYSQDYASNEFQNTYNRALNTYDTNANNYYTGQNNTYNRYAGLANTGLTASGLEGSIGSSAASGISQLLASLGNSQAAGTNNAAAATASGIVGGTNALTAGLSGVTGGIGSGLTLSSLLQSMRQSGYGNSTDPNGGVH